jgi:prevent-host-death family protein
MSSKTSSKAPQRAARSSHEVSRDALVPSAPAHRPGAPFFSAGQVVRHTITEARSRLPELVRRAASGAAPVAIGRKGEDQAVLVSFAEFAALASQLNALSNVQEDAQQVFARLIAQRLLPGAPAHLVESQAKELASLTLEELAVLVPITRLPMTAEQRRKAQAIRDGETLTRLERRDVIARTIAQATTDGLYDALEHRTSAVTVWDDKAAAHGTGERTHGR